jgi:hypothetical protein
MVEVLWLMSMDRIKAIGASHKEKLATYACGMACNIKDGEFRAMLALADLKKRYGYCVKKIADAGSLYWLESDKGRCVIGPDERGATMLPVWPHPRFAEDYLARDPVALASWVGSEPIEIDVHEFLDVHMPQLLAGGYAIAAFPVAPGKAAVVRASEFETNLRHELSQIE